MSTKDYATMVFNSLSENQLLDFMKLFADDNTLARFESDLIASGNSENKIYNSFDEILQEMDEEDNE